MSIRELVCVGLLVTGGLFFLAGTLGVLRFPDARSRLHAVTKSDTLGLGFVVVGLIVLSASVTVAVKLLLVWLFAITSSATASYLIAGRAGDERP